VALWKNRDFEENFTNEIVTETFNFDISMISTFLTLSRKLPRRNAVCGNSVAEPYNSYAAFAPSKTFDARIPYYKYTKPTF
jgi:hypothetical protein